MIVLEYTKWQNFHSVILVIKKACELSHYNVSDQFTEVRKLIVGGKGNKQKALD